MKLTDDQAKEFLGLIEAVNTQTEVKCGEFLDNAADLLLSGTPQSIVKLKKEQWNFFGRSDYMIVADMLSTTSPSADRVIEIWEPKAPQCPLMEADGEKGRFKPSKDLIKAETQLLHYAYEARRNGNLQEVHSVRYPDKIRPAGIIIGRHGKYVRSGSDEDQKAAQHSFEIRMASFYKPLNIRILTWDYIYEYVAPTPKN